VPHDGPLTSTTSYFRAQCRRAWIKRLSLYRRASTSLRPTGARARAAAGLRCHRASPVPAPRAGSPNALFLARSSSSRVSLYSLLDRSNDLRSPAPSWRVASRALHPGQVRTGVSSHRGCPSAAQLPVCAHKTMQSSPICSSGSASEGLGLFEYLAPSARGASNYQRELPLARTSILPAKLPLVGRRTAAGG